MVNPHECNNPNCPCCALVRAKQETIETLKHQIDLLKQQGGKQEKQAQKQEKQLQKITKLLAQALENNYELSKKAGSNNISGNGGHVNSQRDKNSNTQSR